MSYFDLIAFISDLRLLGGGMLWGSRVANDDVVFLEHVIRFVWWICCLK